MDSLQTISPVVRLDNGKCPYCNNNLRYFHRESHTGILDNNGSSNTDELLYEKYMVYCERCKYQQKAIQIGLKIIPIDRIVETDRNWDKKYLEENTLVYGEKGKNPFIKDKE